MAFDKIWMEGKEVVGCVGGEDDGVDDVGDVGAGDVGVGAGVGGVDAGDVGVGAGVGVGYVGFGAWEGVLEDGDRKLALLLEQIL